MKQNPGVVVREVAKPTGIRLDELDVSHMTTLQPPEDFHFGSIRGEGTTARVIVEAWRREYNEERPEKSLDGLTPAAYAQTLIQKPVKLTPDSKAQCY